VPECPILSSRRHHTELHTQLNAAENDLRSQTEALRQALAERDELAKVVAEIGDVMSPTGERPVEALGSLVDDVAQLVEQRDMHAADAQVIADSNDLLRERLATATELAREVLAHFHERGHPGRPCKRTGWVTEERISAWWAKVESLTAPAPSRPAG